jgi:hypothetical protein
MAESDKAAIEASLANPNAEELEQFSKYCQHVGLLPPLLAPPISDEMIQKIVNPQPPAPRRGKIARGSVRGGVKSRAHPRDNSSGGR